MHVFEQSEEGLREFRAHLTIIKYRCGGEKFYGLLRDLTDNNAPMITALLYLIENK